MGPAVSNPFIGPRAFETGERLFGRDREVRTLFDLLVSERIVLLHAPSGAGKSSLLQAALVPRLLQEEFHVWPMIRVNAEPTEADVAADWGAGSNRHVLSALRSLERGLPVDRPLPPMTLRGLTLPAFFSECRPAGLDDDQVLIFDQFEEILTVAPNDLEAKLGFFDQVGALLRQPTLHAVFALRDEFVGALEPYRRRIPRGLETRFRLDLLGAMAAREAVVGPSRASGVPITEEAATVLVDDLRAAHVRRGGRVVVEVGRYVDPVQLQVVCYRLWERHRADGRIDADSIQGEAGDVDAALAEFYADCIAKIRDEQHVPERMLRDWCEQRLITPRGNRGQVQAGDEAEQGLPDRAIGALIDSRLVRAEERRGIAWYELAHDRLIEPIRKDDSSWREQNLSPIQRRAMLWEQSGRPSGLLLHEMELAEAERWAEESAGTLTSLDQEFLSACREARVLVQRQREEVRREVAALRLRAFSMLLAFILILFGLTVWQWRRAEQLRLKLEKLEQLLEMSRALSHPLPGSGSNIPEPDINPKSR